MVIKKQANQTKPRKNKNNTYNNDNRDICQLNF